MFRMNGKNRKKASKEKNVESKQKYQEDFNEIILNDLVPEEKKEEFGINSIEDTKPKKSGGVKLNFGLGGKKSSSKSKKTTSNPKDSKDKTTNQNKKNDNTIEESSKTKKGTNKSKNKKKNTPSKESNKKSSKGKNTKKTKSSKPSKSNIEEIILPPVEDISNKKVIGPKKKRVKNSINQVENENKRNIDENENNYEVKDNFDCVNFRNLDDIDDTTNNEAEAIKELTLEEKPKNKFENLVWSEDKFPQK